MAPGPYTVSGKAVSSSSVCAALPLPVAPETLRGCQLAVGLGQKPTGQKLVFELYWRSELVGLLCTGSFLFLIPQIKIEPVSFKSEKDTCVSIVCKEVLLAGSACEILSLNHEQFLKPNAFSVLQMDFLAETSRWSCSTLPA